MARFSKGRRALAISDRSGVAFPYREMVKEWTGAWVHTSEFEVKQPQLQPHPVGADPQGLLHARPRQKLDRAHRGHELAMGGVKPEPSETGCVTILLPLPPEGFECAD